VRASPRHTGEDPTFRVSFVKEATDYLAYIKALIVVNPQVLRVKVQDIDYPSLMLKKLRTSITRGKY